MGLLYAAGFQVGGAATMTVTINAGVATITPGYYMQGDFDTSAAYTTPSVNGWTGQQYTGFADAVASALTAAAGATVTCAYSRTTGKFTIAKALTFTLSFATAADLRLRAALGFTGNKSGANTYTSDQVPNFSLFSAITGRTNVQGPFEPDDIAEESVSDGGVDYVITRKTSEQLMSWDQAMEPRAAVYPFARAAGGSTLWTWQDWFRHVRGTHPFVVHGDALEGEPEGAFYRYTAKGAASRPRRFMSDFDDYWVLPNEVRWLAQVEPP